MDPKDRKEFDDMFKNVDALVAERVRRFGRCKGYEHLNKVMRLEKLEQNPLRPTQLVELRQLRAELLDPDNHLKD